MAGKKNGKGSRKGAGKKRGSNSKIDGNILGYLNPFVDTDARIPDGRVIASLPHRYVNVGEMEFDDADTGHIVIYPGLDSALMWFATDSNGQVVDNNVRYFKLSGDESWLGGGQGGDVIGNANLGECVWDIGGDVSRWRTVSQGLRIANLNSDEDNGGWFESCNLHYKPDIKDFEAYSPQGNHDAQSYPDTQPTRCRFNGKKAYLRPTPNVCADLIPDDANLAETQNYRCGTLRSIAATAFTLPIFAGSHAFRKLQEFYHITPGAMNFKSPDAGAGGMNNADVTLGFTVDGFDESFDLLKTSMDSTHDLVYIKIHPGGSIVDGRTTKMLLQLCTNQEVVYDINSTLHKHMRASPAKKKQLPPKAGGAAVPEIPSSSLMED